MKKFFLILLFGGALILSFGFRDSRAEALLSPLAEENFTYEIQDLPGTPVMGDFVVGPGKTELWMDPGDKAMRQLMVTNRLGETMKFRIEIEDFRGSRDPQETVILLGGEKGPYSLRDYLYPEISEFTLDHGQRIILPIEVSIPEDAESGGLYGAVITSTRLPEIEGREGIEEVEPGVGIISRIGTLFFIRVKGEIIEDGFLKEFKTPRVFFEKGPIPFELLFQNDGTVHLMPYGIIEIRNLLGRKMGEVELDPWFAMPDSLRLREAQWEKGFLFGRYTALASVNRGYGDIIDQKSIDFWVIPWKIVLAGFVGLFLIILFFRWLFSKFEIRRKTA